MHVKELLTPKNPLGPFRHETIINRAEDASKANVLIYQSSAFDDVFAEERPIIVGRRGAGKTAIIAALAARSGSDDYTYAADQKPGNRDIYILVSYEQLDILVERVGHDCRYSIGGDGDWASLLAETAARHWSRRIWTVILDRMYRECQQRYDARSQLLMLVKYIEGKDVVAPDHEITDDALAEKFNAVTQSTIGYLEGSGRNCYVIIDSFEEYPVLAPRFQKIIAGFLKCLNNFNATFTRVHIVCCIPEEMESFFIAKSTNYLKDWSLTASVSKLRWKPIDLLRIVAERYRQFLIIHSEDDKDFLRKIKKFDMSRRDDLRSFYSLIMPDVVENRLGKTETALAYIVRHTQLLPREFLMIFDSAITASHKRNGSWRYIDPRGIVEAVEAREPELARMTLQAYQTLYPTLIEAAQKVIPELPPICRLGDLHKLGGRLKAARHETSEPWQTLFDIGIIGYIEDMPAGTASDRYEYGRFHFNSIKPITFANDRKYCIHPIFSGSWNLKRPDASLKCVYPADVSEAPWA
jgi:hypothetical protein